MQALGGVHARQGDRQNLKRGLLIQFNGNPIRSQVPAVVS